MWAILLAFVTPVVGRVLFALGFGFITYTAYGAAIDTLKTLLTSNLSAVGADMLAFITMAGFIEGLGYVFAALTVRVALVSIARLGRIV